MTTPAETTATNAGFYWTGQAWARAEECGPLCAVYLDTMELVPSNGFLGFYRYGAVSWRNDNGREIVCRSSERIHVRWPRDEEDSTC